MSDELDPEARNRFRAAIHKLEELYADAISIYTRVELAAQMDAPDFRVRLQTMCLSIESVLRDMNEAVPPIEAHDGLRLRRMINSLGIVKFNDSAK